MSVDEVIEMAQAGTPRLVAVTPETLGIKRDLDAADLRLAATNYLYLSGTPFRALTQGEFLEDQVYNWTYSDEQRAKFEQGEAADAGRGGGGPGRAARLAGAAGGGRDLLPARLSRTRA